MKVILVKDYEEMSTAAAERVAAIVQEKPDAVLSFATGSTPIGTYEKLAEFHRRGLDFSRVHAFHLDEYIGLKPDNPNSYAYYLDENVFTPLDIPSEQVHVHCAEANRAEEEARKYDVLIEKLGGIDLQILGIGENGHIAFLEPGEKLPLESGIMALTQDTIEVNSRFFESVEEVPHHAVTLGLRSILGAKKILLLINGPRKHEAVRRLLNEPYLNTQFPVSALLLHKDCTLIVDEQAYAGE